MALPRDPDPYTEHYCVYCERDSNLKHVTRDEPVEPSVGNDRTFECAYHGELDRSETLEVAH